MGLCLNLFDVVYKDKKNLSTVTSVSVLYLIRVGIKQLWSNYKYRGCIRDFCCHLFLKVRLVSLSLSFLGLVDSIAQYITGSRLFGWSSLRHIYIVFSPLPLCCSSVIHRVFSRRGLTSLFFSIRRNHPKTRSRMDRPDVGTVLYGTVLDLDTVTTGTRTFTGVLSFFTVQRDKRV